MRFENIAFYLCQDLVFINFSFQRKPAFENKVKQSLDERPPAGVRTFEDKKGALFSISNLCVLISLVLNFFLSFCFRFSAICGIFICLLTHQLVFLSFHLGNNISCIGEQNARSEPNPLLQPAKVLL